MSQYPIIKKCFKCHMEKELSEFYAHSQMLDGHLNKCKICTKIDSNKHRSDNLEKVKEYDRNRPNAKERTQKHVGHMEQLKKENPSKYKKMMDSKKKWSLTNRHKRTAHNLARREAMKNNLKVDNCQLCGKGGVSLDGHHFDYSKPKEVTYLCKRCHGLAHKAINEDRREELLNSTN